MARACALLIVGNLLDGIFTVLLLQLHLVDEVNPLMRWAYGGSPLWFMLVKLTCVHLSLLMLWSVRHVPAAQLAIKVGAAIYGSIVLYHLSFLRVLAAILFG